MSTPPLSDDLPRFVHRARTHLAVVRGRLQLLRRDADRDRTDLPACVGRLDDIELSVRRLEQLIDDLTENHR